MGWGVGEQGGGGTKSAARGISLSTTSLSKLAGSRDTALRRPEPRSSHLPASARVETTVNHFHEKLLRLRGLMKTETGRAMAEKRHDRMVAFLEHFHEEWEGA